MQLSSSMPVFVIARLIWVTSFLRHFVRCPSPELILCMICFWPHFLYLQCPLIVLCSRSLVHTLMSILWREWISSLLQLLLTALLLVPLVLSLLLLLKTFSLSDPFPASDDHSDSFSFMVGDLLAHFCSRLVILLLMSLLLFTFIDPPS